MDKLTNLFLKLVSIPSPSGKEIAVGNFINDFLNKNEIKCRFDNSGKINHSNSGNLIVKLEGNINHSTILFVTHMDTVETGDEIIKPIFHGNVIKSQGNTILGADNKASVACLMESLVEISSWEKHPTIIAVFSTREESGQMGVRLLEIPEKIDFAFNIDGTGNIGTFVNKALGEIPFEIKIFGKAAHAAVEPEKGVNALKAAGLILSELKLGKDMKGSILNVGKISGGKANNIIPDEVAMSGQARAFTKAGIDKILEEVEKTVSSICKDIGCSYQFIKKPEEGAPPFSFPENHKIIQIAKKAAKSSRIPFSLESGSFTCEANYLARKYPVLNVCRGGKMPHSVNESITLNELEKLKDIIKALISQLVI